MNWLLELYRTNATAHAIAVISLVCTAGMVFGGVKVRGIGLGTAAVLFVGIVVGRFSNPIDERTLEFVKEFGLVLFVFCIGLQLGPGFFASLRRVGFRLNLLAAAVVALGALSAVGIGKVLKVDSAAVLGLFSGATTNTPSLGAAQQAISEMPGVSPDRAALPALAYAVSYPVAIVGIIASLLVLKLLLRIDPRREARAYASELKRETEPLERRTLVIESPSVEGTALKSIPGLTQSGVVISRILPVGQSQTSTVTSSTLLHRGDRILAVGTRSKLDQLQRIIGSAVDEDLAHAPGPVVHRRVAVTNKSVLGKTIRQLDLVRQFGVTATRITRADLEMTAVSNLELQFGDVVQLVGEEAHVTTAAELLGNSLKALNETHFVSLFAGIVLGIILGTLPIAVPGLPQPLRLGLAGGPLIVAILVGRLGRIGPLVWHMPLNANLAFREFGISLFFASVGLLAGPKFFSVVLSSQGLIWMAAGACVTVLPLVLVGLFSLAILHMNFVVVSGLLAGSMTDPPALAFATNICGSEAPTVSYAAVYPLTTMLRILAAQVLAVMLCG